MFQRRRPSSTACARSRPPLPGAEQVGRPVRSVQAAGFGAASADGDEGDRIVGDGRAVTLQSEQVVTAELPWRYADGLSTPRLNRTRLRPPSLAS
jgi:hypothetical protein